MSNVFVVVSVVDGAADAQVFTYEPNAYEHIRETVAEWCRVEHKYDLAEEIEAAPMFGEGGIMELVLQYSEEVEFEDEVMLFETELKGPSMSGGA